MINLSKIPPYLERNTFETKFYSDLHQPEIVLVGVGERVEACPLVRLDVLGSS